MKSDVGIVGVTICGVMSTNQIDIELMGKPGWNVSFNYDLCTDVKASRNVTEERNGRTDDRKSHCLIIGTIGTVDGESGSREQFINCR